MNKDVFDFLSYKTYLKAVLKAMPAGGHGFRSRMAEATGCQMSYISQILNRGAHFSLEQAEALNTLLGHSVEESEFFLMILQYERAGTPALRERLKTQIDRILSKRLVLKDRVDIKESLSVEHQAVYYSSWHYAAIHILVTIREFQTREAIANYLSLKMEQVNRVLEFLVQTGLVISAKGKLTPGVSRMFLGNDSPMIAKHHTNWRVRAIDSLDKDLKTDVHLSTVVSLSSEDVLRIKEKIVKDIESTRAIIKDSANENEIHCFCVDFFKV